MKHLTIDAYHISSTVLQERSVLYATLNDLPGIIGMQKACKPFLKDIKTSNPLDDGMSGFVIINTSHVSLHAWPPYGMLNLDVFSCLGFESQDVFDYLHKHFGVSGVNMEINEITRAVKSPRDMMLAYALTSV